MGKLVCPKKVLPASSDPPGCKSTLVVAHCYSSRCFAAEVARSLLPYAWHSILVFDTAHAFEGLMAYTLRHSGPTDMRLSLV